MSTTNPSPQPAPTRRDTVAKERTTTRKAVTPTLPGATEDRGEGANCDAQTPHPEPLPGVPGRGSEPGCAGAGGAAGGVGGEKRGELFAGIGSPGTGSSGEEREEFFATVSGTALAAGGDLDLSPAGPLEGRRGRPSVMDGRLQEQVCLLISLGLSRRQTAAHLSIVHGTIANAIARDPEFAERVARAEQMSVVKPLLHIVAASQKNTRAAIWLVNRNEKRLPKDDDEEREAHENALRKARQDGELMTEIVKGMDARKEETR